MLLYNLLQGSAGGTWRNRRIFDVPPKLFHAIKGDDSFDILHPALRGKAPRSLCDRRLRKRRHRSLRQIAALGRRGIKPEGPGGVKGVLLRPHRKHYE